MQREGTVKEMCVYVQERERERDTERKCLKQFLSLAVTHA